MNLLPLLGPARPSHRRIAYWKLLGSCDLYTFINALRVVVWGENVHEQKSEQVRSVYPEGMRDSIADALKIDPMLLPGTATLQEVDHGLPESRLSKLTYSSGGGTWLIIR